MTDFNDGDEGFSEGDTPLADVDPGKLTKLLKLFDAVADRESAESALAEVYGSELEVK